MYKDTWILIANGSKARLLKAESNDDLIEHEAFINVEMRIKGVDLTSDRPGRTFDSVGDSRHAVGEPKDYKEAHAEAFARQICEKLQGLLNGNSLKQLYLISAPHFMGHLNKNLDSNLLKVVKGTIDKDLTSKKPQEIRPYLPAVL